MKLLNRSDVGKSFHLQVAQNITTGTASSEPVMQNSCKISFRPPNTLSRNQRHKFDVRFWRQFCVPMHDF